MDSETYRNNSRVLLRRWKELFPDLQPPSPFWWERWMRQYDHQLVYDTLGQVAAKKPTSTDKAGQAVSAILRDGERLRIIQEEMEAQCDL